MMAEEIRAEMVANVWKVVAAAGDEVAEGDTLVILESMKMEIPVLAESDGMVAADRGQRGRRGAGRRPDRGDRVDRQLLTVRSRPSAADFAAVARLTVAAYEADGQLKGEHGVRRRCWPTWPAGPRHGEVLVAVDDGDRRCSAAVTFVLPGTALRRAVAGPARRSSGCCAVDPAAQGRGVGAALVAGLCRPGRRSWAARRW